jgi:hypothetical protein
MGQAGASAFSNHAQMTGNPASGIVTMPNGMPNYSQHEGMTTAPRHEGLGSVGSVGSVAMNMDGLAVTNFNGVTADGLAATRIQGHQVDGLESCSSVRTRINGFNSDGFAMAHQDCHGYDGSLGYDARAAPATHFSTQTADSVHAGGVYADCPRRFSIESDGVRDEDLHGLIGVEVPVLPQKQAAPKSLAHTVTSMRTGFVPQGYHVGAGDLCTTQEASSTYRDSPQSLDTTTVATNAYIPRSHVGQVPQPRSNNAPSQMHSTQQGRDLQGNANNFVPSTGSSNIAAPAAAFQPQGQHLQMQPHSTNTASGNTPGKPPLTQLPTSASEGQQRASWAVGSVLEVFSATAQKWHVASIVQAARSDGPDVLTVQFLRNGEPQMKQIYRTDAYLAVLGAHTEGEIPPGFQLQPSQSRPGQFVYLDTATSKKYSSAELAWKLHFERLLKSSPHGNAPRTGHHPCAQRASATSMTPYGPAPSIACK